jgi:hypothetical protein
MDLTSFGYHVRMRRMLPVIAAAAACAFLVPAQGASASPVIKYGVQDDAWLAYGPGTVGERAAKLRAIGVSVVRYTLVWNQIAATRPADPRSPGDPAYDWGKADDVLRALRSHGIAPVVSLVGAPRWSNGGRGPSFAPRSPSAMADFATAAAKRYPWVRRWLVWNEPNQRRWLRPTSAATYVRLLLNPAYSAIHREIPMALVGGGSTAPRGSVGGVSPVDFIRGMRLAGARLDAYAHHPYPLSPTETPWSGGCDHCETITMATLDRLLREVSRTWGDKRIWLTEYAYQTNPPDRLLGVSYARQARYLAEGALRAYLAPRVDMLIHYLVQDEPIVGRWQSGLLTTAGSPKPSFRMFPLPLAQMSRSGTRTLLWGQVRVGTRPVYRLQRWSGGRWTWVGPTTRTDPRGFFLRTVTALPGTRFRVWSPRLVGYSADIVVR